MGKLRMEKITEDECKAVKGDWKPSKNQCFVDNEDRFEGRFNSSRRWGDVENNPAGLMQVEGSENPVAVDRISKSKFDAAITRTKHINRGDLTDYILKEKPKVKVFTVDDGKVEKKIFSPHKKVAWSEFATLTGKEYK